MIRLVVPGEPVPAPRPRMDRRGKVYAPRHGVEALERVAAAYTLRRAGPIFEPGEPVVLEVTFNFARPKDHLRTNGKLRPSAPAGWRVAKPDVDNCLKTVADGLTRGGAWADDSQVVGVVAQKRWAPPGEDGSTEITLRAPVARVRATP